MVNAEAPSSVSPSANGGWWWRPRVTALLVLTLASCAYLPPSISPHAALSNQPHLIALSAAECRGLLADDAPAISLQQALARSRDYLEKLPSDRAFTALDRQVTAAELTGMLQALSEPASADDESQRICDRYRLYRAELPQGLLVTGYYQPELSARRRRSDRFRYPLYRLPNDMVEVDLTELCPACNRGVIQGRVRDGKLIPYYSRADIDGGALADRGDEIAWLDDPVEAFFLHVQGSALLRFDDGVQMQVSYSGSNGRPYTSLGHVLVEQGKMEREAVSLQTIKEYLRSHPSEQAQLLETNERYIFFRPVITGPIGSIGVPLTDGSSIAADASVYPRGGLAFMRVRPRHQPDAASDAPVFARLVTIQDAGTAITGAGRIDVFFGTGATAEAIAGEMRNSGDLYLVLPQ